jgi:hypothetical protein
MTNEERVEERLIHAHERGYYYKVMSQVKDMEKQIQKCRPIQIV